MTAVATGTTSLAGCNSGTFGPSARRLTERRTELAGRHDAVVGMRTPENAFVPETVTVGVGDSVVWLNDSEWGHTVTAFEDRIPADADFFTSGGYDSERQARESWPDGDLAVGDTFEKTFETAGTFHYFCVPHDGMTGTVVVEAAENTATE